MVRTANDKDSYSLLLWKSAAEAEYSAFQISILHGFGDYDPEQGSNDDRSDDPLKTAHRLLGEAQSLILSDSKRVYRALRVAVFVPRKAYSGGDKMYCSDTRK